MTPGIMMVSLLFMGISMVVSMILKSKFSRYSKVPLSAGLSGKEVAEKMLRENGIHDVQVTSVQGFLSDHYDPSKKTVNLSPEVYEGRTVAAAAVAAHECGHAVQHATTVCATGNAEQAGSCRTIQLHDCELGASGRVGPCSIRQLYLIADRYYFNGRYGTFFIDHPSRGI